LLADFDPYLNFAGESETEVLGDAIDTGTPDGTFALMSEDEQAFRRQPYNRVKQKIEHINRMVDKIKYANHSDDTRRTLYEHKRILEQNLQEFLGVEDLDH
jgi:hypothetical protein